MMKEFIREVDEDIKEEKDSNFGKKLNLVSVCHWE